MRTRSPVLCCVALAAAIAGGARASNSASFVDVSADAGAAPDVTTVTVANDDAGRVTWRVSVANRERLEHDDVYVLWLDVDLNERNGDRGAEYAIAASGRRRGAWLVGFSDGRWRWRSGDTLRARWMQGGLQLSVDRDEIGRPAQLDFAVASAAGGDADRAPGTRPWWRYGLIVSP